MKAEWRICQKSNQYAPKGQKHIARGTALGKKYRKYQCALQGRVFKIALKSCAFFTYSIDALDHQIWRKVFIR
ncbi:hypothetical protein, partial [uncultured Prevotella sp.]|uniref:hypothetical protein n=1 Tax=uncultured Prevotella sp. TaxID=159272 RepID=UPI0025D7DC72